MRQKGSLKIPRTAQESGNSHAPLDLTNGIKALDILLVAESVLLKEFINLSGAAAVGRANHSQDIVINIVLFQQADEGYYPVKSPLPFHVQPVAVMDFLRPIQGDAHQHAVFRKPLCPGFIQRVPVGLEDILDPNLFGVGVLCYVVRKFPEKLQAGQRRLSPLKGKDAVPVRIGKGLLWRNCQCVSSGGLRQANSHPVYY